MGETITRIKVSNLLNLKWEEIEVIADTGATYTALPCKILDEFSGERKEKKSLRLANE